MENSITSNYVYDLVEKLLNKESHETGYIAEDEKRKKITVDDADENWLNFIIKSLKFKSQRSLKWNFRLFWGKKTRENYRQNMWEI